MELEGNWSRIWAASWGDEQWPTSRNGMLWPMFWYFTSTFYSQWNNKTNVGDSWLQHFLVFLYFFHKFLLEKIGYENDEFILDMIRLNYVKRVLLFPNNVLAVLTQLSHFQKLVTLKGGNGFQPVWICWALSLLSAFSSVLVNLRWYQSQHVLCSNPCVFLEGGMEPQVWVFKLGLGVKAQATHLKSDPFINQDGNVNVTRPENKMGQITLNHGLV